MKSKSKKCTPSLRVYKTTTPVAFHHENAADRPPSPFTHESDGQDSPVTPRMAVSSKSDGPDSAAEPDADHFEFFSFPSPPAMCAAADVFLGGKILPFGAPPPKRAENLGDLCWQETYAASECSRRRRRFWGGRVKAEYRRLRSVSDCHGMVPPPAARQQRPRWYLCVLGSVRVPATMDMSDIRSRQRRQSAAAEAEPGRGPSGDVGRATWRLLRSLSCTGLESASAVTVPLRFAEHVQDT